jgi:hypothetical protein
MGEYHGASSRRLSDKRMFFVRSCFGVFLYLTSWKQQVMLVVIWIDVQSKKASTTVASAIAESNWSLRCVTFVPKVEL